MRSFMLTHKDMVVLVLIDLFLLTVCSGKQRSVLPRLHCDEIEHARCRSCFNRYEPCDPGALFHGDGVCLVDWYIHRQWLKGLTGTRRVAIVCLGALILKHATAHR